MNTIIRLAERIGATVRALLVLARVHLVLLYGGPAVLFGFPAAGLADIVGIASVIDGDTIEIRGERIRLHGVDTPESCQICQDASGRKWRCGQKAALALQDLIGRRTVTCAERDVDRYGRIVALCSVDGIDINEWLVMQGLALAYRKYSKAYCLGREGSCGCQAKHVGWLLHGSLGLAPGACLLRAKAVISTIGP